MAANEERRLYFQKYDMVHMIEDVKGSISKVANKIELLHVQLSP